MANTYHRISAVITVIRSWHPARWQILSHTYDRSREYCQLPCPFTVKNLSDPLAPEPLPPNHLLTLKTQVVLPPPGTFESPDQYSNKTWRRVQYLATQLWLYWQKEYCALLQWTPPRRSMKEGDVELVCDNESQRNQWPLAVVTKVFPSSDQLVKKVKIVRPEMERRGSMSDQ